MNKTTSKIVTLVIATSVLTSVCNDHLMAQQGQTPPSGQDGITGTWQAQDVGFAPWTFTLKAAGAKVTGTVRQGQFNGTMATTLTGATAIYDGAIAGNQVSFKCDSPDGGRTISFSGVVGGDIITFTREVKVQPGSFPGMNGIYGASGATNFTAKRVVGETTAQQDQAGMMQQSALPVQQDQGATGQPGMPPGRYVMTLEHYPPADPQALTDLENKVKERQGTKETTGEITINLKPYINSKLNDPLADQPDKRDHTLADLPLGLNTYGGVPFDVEGIVQLNGPSIEVGAKQWPSEVKDIAIGHPFKKLHLLYGAFNIVAPQAHITFAKMILHYADGSQEELNLDGGTHTLCCVDASIPQQLDLLPSPQTELAWLGTDPYLKQNNPNACLHLYRTTLDNPKPDKQVTSIDYVSTMFNPGPFMVGLTIE
ncbi:MAG: hypothetical protein ABSE16_07290 [Verrucomicrobiota bacterium]|jgi:hypothetical protein